jgi:hypothetical protein
VVEGGRERGGIVSREGEGSYGVACVDIDDQESRRSQFEELRGVMTGSQSGEVISITNISLNSSRDVVRRVKPHFVKWNIRSTGCAV